ncbi:hypothetical protein [Streptomyces endophyticus]|uniref:Uncharacterized protein n=1 Tax=Streptomyces endophyticus TaxID=714166 RepID=A0ABU6EW99_9ACTN|nr:hypothetical protein [Streptomyces endophyticus]MEB8336023.1 hypothetical protein [Streptomyces endophyticus]
MKRVGHLLLPGAAVALAVGGAFPWWSGRTDGDGLGAVPWWLRVLLLGAGVACVVGVGRRRWAWGAAVAGAAAALGGGLSFVLWSRSGEIAEGLRQDRAAATSKGWYFGPFDSELHAVLTAWPEAAPLAAACAGAGVAVAAVLLARRRGVDADELPADGEELGRRVRAALSWSLVGVLLGGVLSVATVEGARAVRDARVEALGPWWTEFADSSPVPRERLHDGSRKVTEDTRSPGAPAKPGAVAWRHTFVGPVALSTCAYEGRARGTLVALEEGRRTARISGRDPKDGRQRWSFTVRLSKRIELSQVAVSGGCAVLVLVGSMVVGIDSYTGRVGGASVLPMPGRTAWRFVTSYRQPVAKAPRMVTLTGADLAHVDAGDSGVVALRRKDVKPVGWGRPAASGCRYLADYATDSSPGTLFMTGCRSQDVLVTLPEVTVPGEDRRSRPDYRVPDLPPLLPPRERSVSAPSGCDRGAVERIRATSPRHAYVMGSWRCGSGARRERIHTRATFNLSYGWPRRSPWARVPVGRSQLEPVVNLENGDAGAVGDTVRLGWGEELDAEGRPSVTPARGDRIAALVGPGRTAGDRDTLLALGESGLLTAVRYEYRDHDPGDADDRPRARIRRAGATDAVRGACEGTRDVLVDGDSATALVLCRGAGQRVTRVEAVVDGKGFRAAR